MLAQSANSLMQWLPFAMLGLVVVLVPISILMMRFIFGRVTSGWLVDFPAKPIPENAVWRNPGHMTIGTASGNAYTVAMDEAYLHFVPVLPMRLFFAFPARSVPWSAIEVTQVDGDQATALIGGQTFKGPAWTVDLARKTG
jgi:hypothetical protein